jgi:hypothetical protein
MGKGISAGCVEAPRCKFSKAIVSNGFYLRLKHLQSERFKTSPDELDEATLLTAQDTPKGATASVRIYSLVETAKVKGQEPYTWLRHLL